MMYSWSCFELYLTNYQVVCLSHCFFYLEICFITIYIIKTEFLINKNKLFL